MRLHSNDGDVSRMNKRHQECSEYYNTEHKLKRTEKQNCTTMNNLQMPFSLLRLEQLPWVDKVWAQYSIFPEEMASTSSYVFNALLLNMLIKVFLTTTSKYFMFFPLLLAMNMYKQFFLMKNCQSYKKIWQAVREVSNIFHSRKIEQTLGYSRNHSFGLKGSQELCLVQHLLKAEAIPYFIYQQISRPD